MSHSAHANDATAPTGPSSGEDGAKEESLHAGDPLEQAQHELAASKEALLRTLAEMDNLRKRTNKEIEDSRKYGVTNFARDMIQVQENLYRAIASIPDTLKTENEQVRNLAEGVEMTLREMQQVFARYGISRIEPKGEKFDHHVHQAVSSAEAADQEEGTVLEVLQAGYIIQDRLLKPAMVVVAARPQAAQPVDTKA